MSERAYIALGANIGDRAANLAHARAAIAMLPGTRVLATSAVEETEPFGVADQPSFLNQMVAIETTLSPDALLEALLNIERSAGRDRSPETRWGPRTLDCDIVLFGDRAIATSTLTVPHPGITARDFWRRELAALGVDVSRAVGGAR